MRSCSSSDDVISVSACLQSSSTGEDRVQEGSVSAVGCVVALPVARVVFHGVDWSVAVF